MSIIGLPPTGGMWSKWFLVMGTLEAEYYIPLLVLLISSLLNVAYLLPIAVRGFFSEPESMPSEDRPKGIKEAPLPCLIAIAITSIGCVALFFYPEPVYELMQSIAE